jgi:hypothetical protein
MLAVSTELDVVVLLTGGGFEVLLELDFTGGTGTLLDAF